MKTEIHVQEKPELVGILRKLPSFHFTITPQKMPDGRVSFNLEAETGEYRRALQALADNTPIGSRDVLESIRLIRTLMFTTKSAGAPTR